MEPLSTIRRRVCMVFELITGDILFDPHEGDGHDRDEGHDQDEGTRWSRPSEGTKFSGYDAE